MLSGSSPEGIVAAISLLPLLPFSSVIAIGGERLSPMASRGSCAECPLASAGYSLLPATY
jgi:hypothetical protein